MENQKKTLTCNQTRNVRTEVVTYSRLNDKDTLFGGDIMAHFDIAGGRAVFNFLKRPSFTASVDSIEFVRPVYKNEAFYVESYVSGCGKTSVEVFVKMISSNPLTEESHISAFAFMTFVLADRSDASFKMPLIQPESEEEKTVCAGYADRRKASLAKRNQNDAILSRLSDKPIWAK
ncbi:Hypothetical protein Tpal_1524 [Trichococcus palustris]|jgi:acyl-CoA hydrolase|uniref:HotDog ACOT-type domain-containing protein n=1 Tax=Trichococcus palustris TaxID=140314 RepID=A0A143YMN3_9LACT|nr:acyl-CoA thioesterase [Trichococcus palustris]CZQ92653.1 Hypothetical protein Tpal_1524 [Trichococcus palustris]SFL05792.1 Acyl-CoA hydrolase [Trichococcus palustris]